VAQSPVGRVVKDAVVGGRGRRAEGKLLGAQVPLGEARERLGLELDPLAVLEGDDGVDAGRGVGLEDEGVPALAAVEPVGPVAALEAILAALAIEGVVAALAAQLVPALEAVEDVVASEPTMMSSLAKTSSVSSARFENVAASCRSRSAFLSVYWTTNLPVSTSSVEYLRLVIVPVVALGRPPK
jgi:hypothetical protein